MVKKLLILISLLLFCAGIANAQKVKILGIAGQSNTVVTSGVSSSTKAFRTLPGCTVTILNADGTNATIYSDAVGSSKSNPYTSSVTDATYDFFITPGAAFSVRFSGLGVSSAFTRSGYVAPGTMGFSLPLCAGSNDTAILSAANTAGGTIEIPNGVTCASNSLTISANLQIDKGGLLKPITGQTVTLTGPQNSGNWQKFTNVGPALGAISITGNVSQIDWYDKWWGLKGGTVNAAADTLNLQGMAATFTDTAGKTIHFTPGNSYYLTSEVIFRRLSQSHILGVTGYGTVGFADAGWAPRFVAYTAGGFSNGGTLLSFPGLYGSIIEGISTWGSETSPGVNTNGADLNIDVRQDELNGRLISQDIFVGCQYFSGSLRTTWRGLKVHQSNGGNAEYMKYAHNSFWSGDFYNAANATGYGIEVLNTEAFGCDFDYNAFSGCERGVSTDGSLEVKEYRNTILGGVKVGFYGINSGNIVGVDSERTAALLDSAGNQYGGTISQVRMDAMKDLSTNYVISNNGGYIELGPKVRLGTDSTNAPLLRDRFIRNTNAGNGMLTVSPDLSINIEALVVPITDVNLLRQFGTFHAGVWQRLNGGLYLIGGSNEIHGSPYDFGSAEMPITGTNSYASPRWLIGSHTNPDTNDFGLGRGITQNHILIGDQKQIDIGGLSRPMTARVSYVGANDGAQTIRMYLIARNTLNQRTLISEEFTAAGNTTLSGSNYIHLEWLKCTPADWVASGALLQDYILLQYNGSDYRIIATILPSAAQLVESYDIVANPAAAYTYVIPTKPEASQLRFHATVIQPEEITFTSLDTSPDVGAGNDFVTANAGATSITTFDNGTVGQIIRIRVADANTTFVDGATLITGTGANIVAVNGRVYSFILRGTAWRGIK